MASRATTPALESNPIQTAEMVKDATKSPVSTTTESSAASNSPIFRSHEEDQYWPIIATKDDIPGWLKDNDYIIGGHPMPTYSYKRSFRLWRCLHMETMNIWTHLIGCAAMGATGIILYSYAISKPLNVSVGDKIAFGMMIVTAFACFGLSTTFHTLRSHSYHVHHLWGRFDIFGICLLALGGGTSATYYAFYCDQKAQRIYWTLDACAAVGAGIVLFDTGGGGNKMRTLRGMVFAFLVLISMLPIFHGIGRLGWDLACRQIGAQWYLSEILVLTFGVSLFVGRLPERLSPGTFDVWGHSHQLHHTCAVVAVAFHIVALVTSFRYRQANLRC